MAAQASASAKACFISAVGSGDTRWATGQGAWCSSGVSKNRTTKMLTGSHKKSHRHPAFHRASAAISFRDKTF